MAPDTPRIATGPVQDRHLAFPANRSHDDPQKVPGMPNVPSAPFPSSFSDRLNLTEDEKKALRLDALPEGGTFPNRIFFLEEAEIRDNAKWSSLPEAVTDAALRAAEKYQKDPDFRFLLWQCRRLAFDSQNFPDTSLRQWRFLEKRLGEDAGMLSLLLILSTASDTRRLHQSWGIPETITRDNLLDIPINIERYQKYLGAGPGMTWDRASWFRHHAFGTIFRLGRFQYIWMSGFQDGLRVYRHRSTGEVLALAESGMALTGEGFFDGIGNVYDPQNGWISLLTETADRVIGYPVSPNGFVTRHETVLALPLWEMILGKDTPVLDIHIPSGGGMAPDVCLASLRAAEPFFRKYFPEKSFHAFRCTSWILNTQLQDLLEPEANLVKLQREGYLYPAHSSGRDGIFFLFDGHHDIDPKTAPRDTSIRRAVIGHLETGKNLRSGGMFILKGDLKHWGRQLYRSQERWS